MYVLFSRKKGISSLAERFAFKTLLLQQANKTFPVPTTSLRHDLFYYRTVRSFSVKRKDGAVLNLTGNLFDNQKYSPVLSTLVKEVFEQVIG